MSIFNEIRAKLLRLPEAKQVELLNLIVYAVSGTNLRLWLDRETIDTIAEIKEERE